MYILLDAQFILAGANIGLLSQQRNLSVGGHTCANSFTIHPILLQMCVLVPTPQNRSSRSTNKNQWLYIFIRKHIYAIVVMLTCTSIFARVCQLGTIAPHHFHTISESLGHTIEIVVPCLNTFGWVCVCVLFFPHLVPVVASVSFLLSASPFLGSLAEKGQQAELIALTSMHGSSALFRSHGVLCLTFLISVLLFVWRPFSSVHITLYGQYCLMRISFKV